METILSLCEKLDAEFNDDERAILRDCPDSNAALGCMDRGFMMSLRNEWGFWDSKSPVHQCFAAFGVTWPDTQSALLIHCYWEWLHGKRAWSSDDFKD